jgi:hypothetical protein
VFSWSAIVSGGSGSYTFKYSLVSLSGGSPIVLKDFSDGYTSLPAGKTSMTTTFTLTLTENHINLINSQKYAMQMEVRDSLGATTAMYAAPATLNEMNFVAPAPVSKVVNKTIRVGYGAFRDPQVLKATASTPRRATWRTSKLPTPTARFPCATT